MWQSIEQFCRAHQFTIAAVGAIGTMAAVIVSIVIALAASRLQRPKLKASLSFVQIIGNDIPGGGRPEYARLSITNVGTVPLRLGAFCFYWKIPFTRYVALVQLLDSLGGDEYIPAAKYPIIVPPCASHSIFLGSKRDFHKGLLATGCRLTFARSLRMQHQRAYVETEDGRRFSVRVSRQIREELARIGQEASTKRSDG